MNNKKAFIFDLDGVLINCEPQWETVKKEIFTELFGEDIYKQLGLTVGLNIGAIHERAINMGATASLSQLVDAFHKYALIMYSRTLITDGIQELGDALVHKGYAIGVVSASPRDWMELVVNRLSFKSHINIVVSLEERTDLAHKPAPDGYLESIKRLGASPKSTIILEDSNIGIASAKASGAYVIGLKQNLVEGYVQEGADIYVNKVIDLIKIIGTTQVVN